MKVFFFFLIAALALICEPVYAQTNQKLGVDQITVGNSTSVNKTIKFDINAGSANPKIRANQSTGKIELSNDGGSTWGQISTGGTATVSKTGAYTITSNDDNVIASASGGAFTLTLPAASSVSGKSVFIVKTDSTLNAVTVSGGGSDTVDGTTSRTLNTVREAVTLVSDGVSNWAVKEHRIPSEWVSYTPTISGFGTVSSVTFLSRRKGTHLEIAGSFLAGTVAASVGTVTFGFNGTNGGLTSTAYQNTQPIGSAFSSKFSSTHFGVIPLLNSPTTLGLGAQNSGSAASGVDNGNVVADTGGRVRLTVSIPISGWWE